MYVQVILLQTTKANLMVPLTKSQGVTEVGLIHSLETLNIVKMCADTFSRDIAQDKSKLWPSDLHTFMVLSLKNIPDDTNASMD